MEDVARHILFFLVGSCCWPLPSFNLMNTQYVFLSSQFFCCNHHVLFFLIPSCYLLFFFFLVWKSYSSTFPFLFSFPCPLLLFTIFFSFFSIFLIRICYSPCSFLFGLELLLIARSSFLGLKLLFIVFFSSSLFLVLYFAHCLFLLLFSLHGPLMLLIMFFFSS